MVVDSTRTTRKKQQITRYIKTDMYLDNVQSPIILTVHFSNLIGENSTNRKCLGHLGYSVIVQ